MRRRSAPGAWGLAAAWLASACATAPGVDVSRRVEVEERWYGNAYRQDGSRLGRVSLAHALSNAGEQDRVHSASLYAFNGALLLGGAVGCVLAATQASGSTAAALGGGAVVLTGGSAWLFSRGDARLAEAVRHHGATLPAPRAAAPRRPGEVLLPAVVLRF